MIKNDDCRLEPARPRRGPGNTTAARWVKRTRGGRWRHQPRRSTRIASTGARPGARRSARTRRMPGDPRCVRAQQSSPIERRGDDSFRSRRRGGPTEIGQPLDPPSHRDLTPNLPRTPAGTRRGDDRVPLRRQTRAAVRVPRASARHRASERRIRPARARGHRAGAPEDEPVGPDARVRQGPEQAGAPAHDRQTGALHDGHRRRRRVVARRHEGRLHPGAAVEGAVAGVHPQGVRGRNPPLHGAAHRADARAPGPDQALRPVGGVRGLRLPRRSRREQRSRAEARVRRHPLDEKDSRSRRRRRPVPG